jgi:hypothetical protein
MMETRTININLYKYEELDQKAKDKALDNYRENNSFDFLKDDLFFFLEEELKKNKLKLIDNCNLFYSLSYCQGDGLMFTGIYKFKHYKVFIKHNNSNYYHYNTSDIYIETASGNEAKEEVYDEFSKIYVSICKALEKKGYSIIEEENSEEYISNEFKEREYLFKSNGEVYEVNN